MRTRNLRTAANRAIVLPLVVLAACLAACAASGREEATGRAGVTHDAVCDAVRKLQGPAREEVLAIARLLAIRPAMAIDFSNTTGEYCLNSGGQVMAHFATQPESTNEDIVYFVDAAPLVARGLRLEEFKPLDPDRGKRQPNTWYLYTGKGVEPHHGREMAGRTWLVQAVDVK